MLERRYVSCVEPFKSGVDNNEKSVVFKGSGFEGARHESSSCQLDMLPACKPENPIYNPHIP